MTTLDAALLRAVSAHPGLTFADLLDAVRATGLDVGATEIDVAARALGLEHGQPGAYRYRLPGLGSRHPQPLENEDGSVVIRVASEAANPMPLGAHLSVPGVDATGPDLDEIGRPREPSGDDRANLLGERGRRIGSGAEVVDRRVEVAIGYVVHPDTIASSPAQSTLPGLWQ